MKKLSPMFASLKTELRAAPQIFTFWKDDRGILYKSIGDVPSGRAAHSVRGKIQLINEHSDRRVAVDATQ